MITLAGEVIYYKRRKLENPEDVTKQQLENQMIMRDGELNPEQMLQKIAKFQLKPAPITAFDGKPITIKPKISTIAVYPKPFPFKE